jgi:3-oxoacyl-(acyl-carrier-protein) synthase
MNKVFVTAASQVSEADVSAARLVPKFGRLDLASQLAVLAVESLHLKFDACPRERIGLCLAAKAGCLSTDIEYWRGRNEIGGPSPALFTYTLPSSPLGEVAIRHRLIGPNLCLVGDDSVALAEAADWLRQGTVDGCLCVSCKAISPEAAKLLNTAPEATAAAVFLQRANSGLLELRQNDRDMNSLIARIPRHLA